MTNHFIYWTETKVSHDFTEFLVLGISCHWQRGSDKKWAHRSSGFWAATPTGQVFDTNTHHDTANSHQVQVRQMNIPQHLIEQTTAMSRPVINFPSKPWGYPLTVRMSIVKVWCASASPISHGNPNITRWVPLVRHPFHHHNQRSRLIPAPS